MVPNTGFWPDTTSTEMSAYLVCGPLCRRVEDVMPIMRTLAGPDGVDSVVRTWDLPEPASIDLREVTVYPVEFSGRTGSSASYRKAIRESTQALRERGAKVAELDGARLKQAFFIWSAMMTLGGGPSYAKVLGNGTAISAGRELLRLALGRSRHTFPALAIVALEQLTGSFSGTVERSVAAGRVLQAELEELLGPRGVVLHPPYSRPAPRHYWPMVTPFDFVYTGLFNVLEFPSTVVPVGFDPEGLPVAVQVIGRRGADALTLAVAGALETDFGGWQRANPC
jgi:fatty acid amide hydrolase 2